MYVIVLADQWYLSAYSPGDEGRCMTWRTDVTRAMRFGSRTAACSCIYYLRLAFVAKAELVDRGQ